jgi:hypothetical protein
MARKRKHDEEQDQAEQASRNGASAEAPQAETEESSGGGFGKLLFLVLIAGVLALVLSKDLRAKALDALFGAEEEFDYSSTTMPASDFAASSVGATAS